MTLKTAGGPTDWMIEIAAEADPKFDLREKLPRYREANTEGIWFLFQFVFTSRQYADRQGLQDGNAPFRPDLVDRGRRLLDRGRLALAGGVTLVNACLREILGESQSFLRRQTTLSRHRLAAD